MTDEEKKQAWYIANAQGYVLEFRLSEKTVNSYKAYCTERNKYKTGANPGGGWLPFEEWLENNGFKSLGRRAAYTKDGSQVLCDDLATVASDYRESVYGPYCGIKGYNKRSIIYQGKYQGVWNGQNSEDYWENGPNGYPARILLVRPL